MKDIFPYIETLNKIQDAINSPAIQTIQEQSATIPNAVDISATIQFMVNIMNVQEAMNKLSLSTNQFKIFKDEYSSALSLITSITISNITQSLQPILDGCSVLNIHPKSRKQEQKNNADQISEKVISEIYLPDEKKTITNDSPIITIMPANDRVFSYLAEHPEELYNCTPREFEEFMAQFYSKLGYKAELTKATRDGGKDIILRRPDMIGNMIYYVECKHYTKKNKKVGRDVIQRFTGVIEMDKVNGGFIATTSFFSPDAEKWIIEKDLNYRIQMHDFDTIKNMLKMAVE